MRPVGEKGPAIVGVVGSPKDTGTTSNDPNQTVLEFGPPCPTWVRGRAGRSASIEDFLKGPFKPTLDRFLQQSFEPHPPAMRALKKMVGALNHQQRSALRSHLVKNADRGPARHGALRGPPTTQKILQILVGAPWSSRLDPVTKRFLRSARDENVDALMGRHALTLVNGNEGYYRALNPDMQSLDLVGVSVKNVEQRYLLLDLVRDMLRVGFMESEIDAMVAEAKGPPEEALPAFLTAGRLRVAVRRRTSDAATRPAGVGMLELAEIQGRLSRARWVETQLTAIAPALVDRPESYRDDLGELLACAHTATDVDEALDQRFEAAMSAALGHDLHQTGLTHLKTVAFERRPSAKVDATPRRAETLPDNHQVRRSLHELERRLALGERSAVGGADYATQTFPEEILEAAAAGQLTVVAFDGAREAGIEHILNTYGVEDDRRQGCLVMGLQGIYGSYPRSLVTLEDGSQFLLVTGYGESRQLNNAAMLLLFKGRCGARIEAMDLDLATDSGDRIAQFRADIEKAIDGDWKHQLDSILGVPIENAADITTRLMIIQNPQQLELALPGRIQWGIDPEDTLVPTRLGYVKTDDGQLERIIVPKVGGGGVYGDTAGAFVSAFYSVDRTPLCDDIIFNGAAGGFANTRQLPDVPPGGIIVPTVSVEEYDDGAGRMALPTKLAGPKDSWDPSVRAAFEAAQAHATEHHVAVRAPSIETFPLIHELVDADHASIDVEAGAIVRAVSALRAAGRPVTFTPVYTHSDDPRHSEHDRFDSLAMMGPLFEGSKFDPGLFGLILALAGYSSDS